MIYKLFTLDYVIENILQSKEYYRLKINIVHTLTHRIIRVTNQSGIFIKSEEVINDCLINGSNF